MMSHQRINALLNALLYPEEGTSLHHHSNDNVLETYDLPSSFMIMEVSQTAISGYSLLYSPALTNSD